MQFVKKKDRKNDKHKKSKLPDEAKEGDVIVIRNENIVIDSSTTQDRSIDFKSLWMSYGSNIKNKAR